MRKPGRRFLFVFLQVNFFFNNPNLDPAAAAAAAAEACTHFYTETLSLFSLDCYLEFYSFSLFFLAMHVSFALVVMVVVLVVCFPCWWLNSVLSSLFLPPFVSVRKNDDDHFENNLSFHHIHHHHHR